jgi:flagellar biosynthesis activator protein FlaF
VEGNGLPQALRAQIISLSIWVNKHTSLVIRNQEEIGPLIEINRIIMQGLAPGQGAQAEAG